MEQYNHPPVVRLEKVVNIETETMEDFGFTDDLFRTLDFWITDAIACSVDCNINIYSTAFEKYEEETYPYRVELNFFTSKSRSPNILFFPTGINKQEYTAEDYATLILWKDKLQEKINPSKAGKEEHQQFEKELAEYRRLSEKFQGMVI